MVDAPIIVLPLLMKRFDRPVEPGAVVADPV
jgi:hypothetical protein